MMSPLLEEWKAGLRIPGLPDEWESKNLLRHYGIAVPQGIRLPARPEPGEPKIPPEAADLCPAVVKLCSPHVLHKTEVDGVRLGVSRENLPGVVQELRARFPGEPLLVEKSIRFVVPEFIIGGITDPVFGPAVVVGAGGILTELYKDVASRLCPCCLPDALLMLEELSLAPLFHGFRGLDYDAQGLAELIVAVSQLLAEQEDHISQMDLNPVVFSNRRWLVLDAKIILEA